MAEIKTLARLRDQLAAGEFEFSQHALWRMVERNISDQEIRSAGLNVVIVEDYPGDKYSPSCLLLGIKPRITPASFPRARSATGAYHHTI